MGRLKPHNGDGYTFRALRALHLFLTPFLAISRDNAQGEHSIELHKTLPGYCFLRPRVPSSSQLCTNSAVTEGRSFKSLILTRDGRKREKVLGAPLGLVQYMV